MTLFQSDWLLLFVITTIDPRQCPKITANRRNISISGIPHCCSLLSHPQNYRMMLKRDPWEVFSGAERWQPSSEWISIYSPNLAPGLHSLSCSCEPEEKRPVVVVLTSLLADHFIYSGKKLQTFTDRQIFQLLFRFVTDRKDQHVLKEVTWIRDNNHLLVHTVYSLYCIATLIIMSDRMLVLCTNASLIAWLAYYSLGNHTGAKTIISMHLGRKWQTTLSQKPKIYQVNTDRLCINIIWCEIQVVSLIVRKSVFKVCTGVI